MMKGGAQRNYSAHAGEVKAVAGRYPAPIPGAEDFLSAAQIDDVSAYVYDQAHPLPAPVRDELEVARVRSSCSIRPAVSARARYTSRSVRACRHRQRSKRSPDSGLGWSQAGGWAVRSDRSSADSGLRCCRPAAARCLGARLYPFTLQATYGAVTRAPYTLPAGAPTGHECRAQAALPTYPVSRLRG
jgi:hypothetical protein